MRATLSTIVPPNVTADMLTELIAQHPASEARIKRGATLVRAGHVEATTTAGVVLVRSATEQNRAYSVDHAACGCADHQGRAIFCQHMAARALWLAGMRAETDAEQSAPTPELTHRCPACGRGWPTADAMMACFDSHTEADPDAPTALELTGRGYLALVPHTALPPVHPTIHRVPVVLSARAAIAAQELYGDDYSGDAA